MRYYLFTFDINTTYENQTDYHDVYQAICDLRYEGYTVNELETATTFMISHEDQKFQDLKTLARGLFNIFDKWVICQIAKNQSNNEPITSNQGSPFDCSEYED
ncbi:hypothetical protein [Elstera litoralis]|uniref:hypothetical protein n=1 Tax=Elstera litoralis TaxID=552518 RepID=UPI0012ED226E|nr:hypothetical protein [Elstera litoralis]